jgi:excisionase family DNA binding protein
MMAKLTFDQLPDAIQNILDEISSIKLHLQNLPPKNLDLDRWLNLSDLCFYLPDKPAKSTIYGYVQAGTIPFHKKGKKLFFLKSEIDTWLKTGRRKTVAEIKAEAKTYLNGQVV